MNAVAAQAAGALGGWGQMLVLTRRMLEELLAAPAPLIGTLILAPGFLLVQNALFGGVAEGVPGIGGDYLTFIVPGAVLLTTLASGNAGFAVLRDKEDRYFDRLLTMPVSSVAIAAAPLLFGAAFAVANASLLLTLASLLGHAPVTGVPGALAMLAIAGLTGLAIAGFLVTVAVVSESIELLQLADLACFPLLFLSPLTLPEGEFNGWLQTICSLNPATYAVEGLRALMSEGWEPARVLPAFAVVIGCAAAALAAAAVASRHSTARR